MRSVRVLYRTLTRPAMPETPPDMFPLDPVLLDRYLAGAVTAAERTDIELRLAADPALAALVQRLPTSLAVSSGAADADVAWSALAARIAAHDAASAPPPAGEAPVTPIRPQRERRPAPWLRAASRIAAAVLIVSGVGISWKLARSDARSIEAPIGRTVTASLPDGTRITVAGGSRVRWRSAFGTTARDVELRGEAFFDVVHDARRPFRVRAGDAIAEDIGTRFSVRAWPELRAVDVAVEEGIVALGDTSESRGVPATVLRAGQRGRLADGRVAVSGDAVTALAWTRNELAFDNQPLREVLPAIERRFAVQLGADPALDDRRLTARFGTQPLRAVLEAVALSLGARVDSAGGRITFVPAAR